MDPPKEYAPPAIEEYSMEDLAKPLQGLTHEHEEYQKILNVLDNALLELKKNQWRFTPEISEGLKSFFKFYDKKTTIHNNKEEKCLFPLLREKLIESGEHSSSEPLITPVDIMEEEHRQVSQSVSLVFNLLGISSQIPEERSRAIILEHAFNWGQEIVETMKLHIFRENNVLFPLAQKLISSREFIFIQESMTSFE